MAPRLHAEGAGACGVARGHVDVQLSNRLWALCVPLVVLAVMVVRQQLVAGFDEAEPGLLVSAGGALAGWLDPPRAFTLHAGPVHLVTNVFLAVVFGALWVRLGADRRTARRIVAATVIFAGAGALALMVAHVAQPVARVGASGGVYALMAAVATGLWARREMFATPREKAVALALPALLLILLLVIAFTSPGPVDHVTHAVGLALGVPFALSAEKPRVVWPLAMVVGAWFLAALA